MGEFVHLDSCDGRATITLDSPRNRNALSRQLLAELSTCVAEARSASVVVLTHAGPVFSAGADLKERADPAAVDSQPMIDVFEQIMDLPCPTIAALTGTARAGGIGLVASCDLSVVHTSVQFALAEVRIGVAPAIISVPILRRVAPGQLATAMLTGEPFDAVEARRLGLITHVSDDVTQTVDGLCSSILSAAPQAVRETKRLLWRGPDGDRSAAFAAMGALSAALFRSDEAVEGMAAFRERRAPHWPSPPAN